MGGMAAQIPINNDSAANEVAMAKVRADKTREASAGHDGTWVAHPALIPIARSIFDAHLTGPNQLHQLRDEVKVTAAELIAPCAGTITRAGFNANIEVSLRYLAAWLSGQGCVPIHHLMEDAATAEIARMQLWQWLRQSERATALRLDDDSEINASLFNATFAEVLANLQTQTALPGFDKLERAAALLKRLCTDPKPDDFLTLSAYGELAQL